MIECVPNLSEGRDAAAVERIAAACRIPGVRQLDVHSDADHHRTVLTLVGDADPLETCIVALAQSAQREIDLRRHAGVHPRVGALDVVPFVPLGRESMRVCADLARRVGERIARETGIPVFLYGRAAEPPDSMTLAQLRRGGLAGLAGRMERGETRPDYGVELHPTAGAVAVGARGLLVAYNVCLATRDLELARRIARSVRATEGGLAGVQALALALPRRRMIQISMNLTDPEATSLSNAFEAVAACAADAGVAVHSSEIVGLAPTWSIGPLDARALRLEEPLEGKLLERRLEAA
ncbi:MAG: glutamate formimidoyltransferase [Candidatus Bipolaricaulota bacterium]